MANERLRHRLAWRGPVITVGPESPVITSFTVDDATLTTGQQATFSWTTSGSATAWSLDTDGDGDADWTGTTETSRTHTYGSAGSYTPTLTISGPGGIDSEPLSGGLVVTVPPISITDFSVNDTTPIVDTAVTFSWTTSGDTQTGATLDPGDGSSPYTLTTQTSQAHTYTAEDVVDATLVVTAASSSDTDTIVGIDIGPVPASNGVARWSMTTDFGTQRQSTGNVDRTLRIYNASDTDALSTSGLSVPSGMSVVGSLPSTIDPLEWADVTVRMADSTAGSKSGNITLTTSDPDNTTLTIPVTGTVAATGTEVLLRTETQRNLTGSTQNKPPIRFPLVFEKGEVPTTETLVLRKGDETLIATTHWQWGERSTYEDGSLRACVVRCYGPASWSNNTDYTVKVYKAAGSWPAETNSRTTSDITSNCDREIRFKDLRRVYDSTAPSSDVFLTQPAIGSGEFYSSVNDDIVNAAAFKRTAGAICTQWSCWSQARDISGGAADDDLKVETFIEAWNDPDDSGTVKWIRWEPSISNGQWHDSGLRSRSVLYELEVYEAGSSIRNWKRTLSRTSTDVTTGSALIATGENAFPSLSWGMVAKFTGSPPSPITTGKYYPFRINSSLGTGKAIDICNIANPNSPGPWGAGGGQTVVSFTTAGTSFDIECAVMHPMGRAYPLREDDGFDHWVMIDGVASTGDGPKIVPNWSETQILERQRAGQLYPVPIRGVGGTLATQANSTRTTMFTTDYAPWTIMWMPCVSVLGLKNAFDGAGVDQYTGDSTAYFVDLLRGMTSKAHHTQFKLGGNDWPRFQNIRNFDKATNGATSLPYNRIRPSNNGPDKAGASYSGLNSPLPGIRGGDFGGLNFYIENKLSAYDAPNTNQDGHVNASNESHHTSPANIENWSVYGSPLDWRYCVASAAAGLQGQPPGLNSSGGRDRQPASERFYHVLMLGDGPWSVPSSRANGQIIRLATAAMTGPDIEPEVAFFKSVLKDNCDYVELAVQTPSILGPVHKAMGIINAVIEQGGGGAGGQQGWWHARCLVNFLFGYKRAGRLDHDVLDFYTNSIMGVSDRKRTGPGRVVQAKPHLFGAKLGWQYLRCSSANGNLAGAMDDSRHIVTDGWSALTFFGGGDDTRVVFRTDSHVQIREQTVDGNSAFPISQNGDSFYVKNHSGETLPTGTAINTYYYLYDQSVQTRLIRMAVTGTINNGDTMTQGGNTATVVTRTYISGTASDYFIEFTAPSPGAFTTGSVSFSSGGTGTFNATNAQNYTVNYKICTDYANQAATRVTWTGSEYTTTRAGIRFNGPARGNGGWSFGATPSIDYAMQQFNPAACAHTWFRRRDVEPIFVTYKAMLQESVAGWSNFDGGTYRNNYYQALGA